MKTVIDGPARGLRLEEAYRNITQDDNDSNPADTPPPAKSTGKTSNKKRSIIDLTAGSSEDESPMAIENTKFIVKQEAAEDVVVGKGKGKAMVKPVKGGGNVVAKTYRHGDGKVAGKAAVTETVLSAVADHLSPEAQEKREISRINLLRESRLQDRHDRVLEEWEKEINDLKHENNALRERAATAETMLGVAYSCGFTSLAYPPGPAPGPSVHHPSAHVSSMQPFTSNPDQYTVHNNSEANDITGPESMIAEHGQEGAGVDSHRDSEGFE